MSMKEQQSDIDRMIMESHYLTALEIESMAEISLLDMDVKISCSNKISFRYSLPVQGYDFLPEIRA